MGNWIRIACVWAVAGVVAVGCSSGADDNESLVVKGSDTMVELVEAWTSNYGAQNPNLLISVTGGGSGTGIAALLNGTTDVCMASRPISEEERQRAESLGLEPVETSVALDGISIVVHPSNPLASIALSQLKQIYTGEVTNWNEVGGPDQEIVVLSRESSSGTYAFFQEHVLDKQDYTSAARLLTSNATILQSVKQDEGGIGYVGLGYAKEAGDEVKMLGVSATPEDEAVASTEATVRQGAYPIARDLYFYTANEAVEPAKGFIAFCLSEEGQAIVAESGYVSLQ